MVSGSGEPVEIRSHQFAGGIVQAQRNEIDRAKLLTSGNANIWRAVSGGVDGVLVRELLGHVQVVDFVVRPQALGNLHIGC